MKTVYLIISLLLISVTSFAGDLSRKDTEINSQITASYLFLLQDQSIAARHEAVKQLRASGIRVVAQYGKVAIEVIASTEQIEKTQKTGLFSIILKGSMTDKEQLDKLNVDQRKIVTQWNYRFSPEYEVSIKNRKHIGKSWGQKRLEEPLPYTAIDPEEFKQIVARYEKRTGKALFVRPKELKPMARDEFVDYERKLVKIYDDPKIAYHLTRLAYRLGPEWYELISNLPRDLVKELYDQFFPTVPCTEMTGEVAVGIVFVESAKSGDQQFGDSERNGIRQEIQDGLSWLSIEHPDGNLSWVYDYQNVRIDEPNGNFADCTPTCGSTCLEPGWRDPAMSQVTYDGHNYPASWTGVQQYRTDMQQVNSAQYAIVIFVTPYNNCWHGYSNGGRITLAKNMKDHGNWGNWGQDRLDMITAHETAHFFQATDEYTASGTPCSSCDGAFGCDLIPNGNCDACARPTQDCVMDNNDRRLCAYTRAHIGWSDIFIETTTADEMFAGTDNDVWLDIGDRVFVLDTPGHDDREKGNREGYALRVPGLQRNEIKRILIRKSSDDFNGGWKLKRVRGWYQNTMICDVNNINQWLEDDHLHWVDCISDTNIVSYLTVRITTADVKWAGTDDDVTITLDGHSWNLDNEWHNDFERGNTDSFYLDPQTGLYTSNIHSVTIHKSSDGIAGGWKLKGVEVIVNGTSIYNNQSINQWLEDDHRTWSASF